MIGPGLAGASFEAYASGFYSGLVGVLTVQIEDEDGNVVLAPTTSGIVEIDSGGTFSVYRFTGSYPADLGDYVLIWTDADGVEAAEELQVASQVNPTTPTSPTLGPCESWISAEDVADCCGVDVGTFESLFDAVAVEAGMALYELSGRQFSGVCERSVRPCKTRRGCATPWDTWQDDTPSCGCSRLSEVLLAGYPVRQIVSVTIDGDLVSPDTYRLDRWQKLVRVADPADPNQRLYWPACQRMDLPGTEAGTFEVTYLHGVSPPPLGLRAAAQLACELYRACPESGSSECALPAGVVKIERQGVTIDLGEATSWGRASNGSWTTGMTLVDAFLNQTNPNGIRRRPTIYSPDGPQFAERVGS